MSFADNNSTPTPPYLFISGEGVDPVAMPLELNNSLFVGSGSNCRIVLEGNDVDPIHCMFWINDDSVLRIQDWNTEGRTVVNGESVSAETILNSGDKVEICSYQIVPVLTQSDHQLMAHRLANSALASATATPESEDRSSDDDRGCVSTGEVEMTERCGAACDLEVSMDDAPANATPEATSEFSTIPSDDDADADWQNELFVNSAELGAEGLTGLPGLDSQEEIEGLNEEIELLRMEIEQLRFELAERDAHPQTSGNANAEMESHSKDESLAEDDQTLQLVNRLEDLLEELQSSDDRVRGLEELLHFSDQAAQAEKEERQQLESWVTEIEHRVSQRESESEAEMNRILEQLKNSQVQRQQVELQLKQVIQSQGNNLSDASKEIIQKSRIQIQELQQKLEQANQENEQLQRTSPSAEGEANAKEELLQMEQKLMAVQVEASRERAEMARQRAELESLKDELEQKLSSVKVTGGADSRVQAMRQHLRDIHEEEKIALEEKRQNSLSGRISRLLTRVGR